MRLPKSDPPGEFGRRRPEGQVFTADSYQFSPNAQLHSLAYFRLVFHQPTDDGGYCVPKQDSGT